MKKTLAIVALLLVLGGAYLMAGFAYVFTVGHCPPFWPPMSMATGILGTLSTSQGGALLGTLFFGFVFLALGPLLAMMGIAGLLMLLRR